MKLYNSLTRRLEPIEPGGADRRAIRMYVCGPTVYDAPHLGHLRSAFVFDVLRRVLRARGWEVRFVRNVTDVDDKIIERARQEVGARGEGRGAGELTTACEAIAARYLTAYHEALAKLGLGEPTVEPKATDHVVPEMTNLIGKLVLDGAAYETGSGDVYFAVRKFERYGRLSNRTLDELQAGARIEPGEEKRDPLDFALWKAAKPDEPAWKSPWGLGRPGWHIECSAMSLKYLEPGFDIHGGGLDLIFPHHENEIAQAEAAGQPFARVWVHHGLLTVNGEKMSKSLGNFITLEQALTDCGGKADALKVFLLSTHYRSPIDYTKTAILSANRRLIGWMDFLNWAEECRARAAPGPSEPQEIARFRNMFLAAMDDDVNTPKALATLDQLTAWGHECIQQRALVMRPPGDPITGQRPDEEAQVCARIVIAADVLKHLAGELGLMAEFQSQGIPSEVRELAQQREAARAHRDFAEADKLRKKIEDVGFVIADTSGGPVIRPKL
ncbi:MAG TPA: cysteine--tRNA ligase [bacterium]